MNTKVPLIIKQEIRKLFIRLKGCKLGFSPAVSKIKSSLILSFTAETSINMQKTGPNRSLPCHEK